MGIRIGLLLILSSLSRFVFSQIPGYFEYSYLLEIENDTCSCYSRTIADSESNRTIDYSVYKGGHLVYKRRSDGNLTKYERYIYDKNNKLIYFDISTVDGSTIVASYIDQTDSTNITITGEYSVFLYKNFVYRSFDKIVQSYFKNGDSLGQSVDIIQRRQDTIFHVETLEKEVHNRQEVLDSLGRIIYFAKFDDNGNLIDEKRYTYDLRGRVKTKVIKSSFDGKSTFKTTNYIYEGLETGVEYLEIVFFESVSNKKGQVLTHFIRYK